MCGVNGIFAYGSGATPDKTELLRTRDCMRARGPDGFGEWWSPEGRLALAHRRLAIIDLSEAGAQPMSTPDGRYTVSFNGEIYNYRALRAELEGQGVCFRSHSDTEVLLHLFHRDGADMVRRLRGMFAFALWDEEKRELFLARDPYGIKPLYYADDGRRFRFASQVNALLAGGGVSKEIDPAGLTGFFLWGSVPEPVTLYRAIQSLPAGHTMTVTESGVAGHQCYWHLDQVIAQGCAAADDIAAGTETAYATAALTDSVRAHMVADVPVGAFLSAGLDSSTVVGLAQTMTDHPLQTITLAFEEFKDRPVDEVPVAVDIAKHLGVAHHCVAVSMADVEKELGAFLAAMDQPTIDGINTWFVSRAAAQTGLKVVLSGLGGDELLGGYSTFRTVPDSVRRWSVSGRLPWLGQLWRVGYQHLVTPWSKASSKEAGRVLLGGSFAGAYQMERGMFMPWELGQILRPEVIAAGLDRLQVAPAVAENLNDFGQVAYLEATRYMRNQLLRDTDWVGMAHSLEIRVPLVDAVLCEKLIGLAATGRLGENKAVLPKALSRALPASALTRPKTGFTVPIWKWLRKSPELDAWKRVKYLRRSNVHDYNRWAYALSARLPGVAEMLKQ
ncbi:MAG TPA: asparagine synthase (glutamine-hydrolyzing) [Gammaproteobacteria bacterium]|nr:asparagine synthase (glutamine-hydrolyzing) [Gammaproteobacteria bacterium]